MRLSLLYWPAVIAVLWTLSWWLSGAPGDRVLWPENAEHKSIFLVISAAGMIAAGAGRVLLRGGPRTRRYATVWTALFICLALGYASRSDVSDLYDRFRGNIHPSVALSTAQGEAELRRAWDGHYRAEAYINGVPVRMLVDTGASMVLLPYETAARIGHNPRTLDFSLPVVTANGKSMVAPIMLSSVKIGPIALFDVEAAVAQPGMLRSGLLGMSFLDRLDETTFSQGRLIMRN